MGIHFFFYHGNDPLIVQRHANEWQLRYEKKFPDIPIIHIDGREVNGERMVSELSLRANSQSLFGDSVLLRLSSIASTEQGKRTTTSRELGEWFRQKGPSFEGIILLTEYQLYEKGHPLLDAISQQESEGRAKVYQFLSPDDASLVREELRQLALSLRFTNEAKHQMLKGIRSFDAEQRQLVRANSAATLVIDHRRAAIRSVLRSLATVSDSQVSPEDVDTVWEGFGVTSPFVVLRQVERPNSTSLQIISPWIETGDESDFFGLYEMIRRSAVRMVPSRKDYLLSLMAEVEIIVKNGLLSHDILLPTILDRLQHFDATGIREPIVEYRTLWLGSL